MLFALSVRDRVADSFDQPFFMPHLNVGIRAFSDAINNPESHLSKHPDDYDLYRIGTFDPLTGLLVAETPSQIALGKEQLRS